MKKIGITGIIGSGKSTVSGMLRERGFYVIDLDGVAHSLSGQEETLREIERAFGGQFIKNNTIDREKMKELVFQDATSLKKLESIMHPMVRRKILDEEEAIKETGAKVFFIDGPLLFETGLAKSLDKVVVVSTEMNLIRERLRARGVTEEDTQRRLSFQIPLKEKEKMADYVVRNDGTKEDLEKEVDKLVRKIQDWEVE